MTIKLIYKKKNIVIFFLLVRKTFSIKKTKLYKDQIHSRLNHCHFELLLFTLYLLFIQHVHGSYTSFYIFPSSSIFIIFFPEVKIKTTTITLSKIKLFFCIQILWKIGKKNITSFIIYSTTNQSLIIGSKEGKKTNIKKFDHVRRVN